MNGSYDRRHHVLRDNEPEEIERAVTELLEGGPPTAGQHATRQILATCLEAVVERGRHPVLRHPDDAFLGAGHVVAWQAGDA